MKLNVKINRGEHIDQFEVDYQPDMTVLNVLDEIYQHHDPSIAYRYSCRTGLCTTCMMMINGRPDLSCQKTAEPGEDGYLTLAPLPKGKTIRDLIKEY
ncbi:2Fe-2S iron-sulfur cluster-binding protein [Piscibacillus halophilus]|uniref:Succinate dehydrogenase / fumarate reductase iron-sulfur subunit/fumarate reductase iron-sulfur subunit n=1 Tax=Piscibacillus halophilus TaxID=571933 RepID=A0A1H9FXV6_9BACI|nr:2Fe-2S iron-sulfur cluster-binding protein [Piscibacillus halophilus]SEQ42722.1 succinate dehydrogenase / fumarate reductase iron-sulfur subunit/fumarate reductase iron-sulfur subunit [Piscibacillus halophilus]